MDSNNKRIAKNSIALYVRMLFTVSIGLYTSRLVLQYLGVKDFGIYNIVGGVVTLMMFLNSTMRLATSRFLTYYLGINDDSALNKCFNASVQAHLCIAATIVFLGETIGLWFVNTQLNLPSSSMYAANWVYQFSLIAAILDIIQVPYNATVISYERMDIFAIFEILRVGLKLAFVMFLPLFTERLIAYSALIMFAGVIITLCYYSYCIKKINTCKLHLQYSREYFVPLIKYATFDLFGNGTFAVRQQGTNILINQFFGVVYNAAGGVASQASSLLSTFVNNILNAFRPQVIKNYACEDYERMQKLMKIECEMSIILASLIFVPLYLNLDFIMHLWLTEVPQYAVIFCKCILISSVLQIINSIVMTGVHATGKIVYLSLYAGCMNLGALFLCFVFFAFGLDAYWAYISLIICVLLQVFGNSLILQRQIDKINVLNILASSVIPFFVFVISYFVSYLICVKYTNDWVQLILSTLSNCFCIGLLSILLIPNIRRFIISKIQKKH